MVSEKRTNKKIDKGLMKDIHFDSGKQVILYVYILYSLKNKEKSGYELLKEIESKLEGVWVPSKGMIYPLLKEMEDEGVIELREVGKRGKNIYGITKRGIEVLGNFRKYRIENLKEVMTARALLYEVISKEVGGEQAEIFKLLMQLKKEIMENLENKKKRARIFNALRKCVNEISIDGDAENVKK